MKDLSNPTNKKLTPDEKVEAIQKARDFIWDFARENSDADIEQPILAMDKILVKAQEKAKPSDPTDVKVKEQK